MGTKGVAELKNDLLVDSKRRLTDEELQKEIRELYRFAALLDDVKLEANVKDAAVVLDGTVTSSFQKSYAEELAWRGCEGRGCPRRRRELAAYQPAAAEPAPGERDRRRDPRRRATRFQTRSAPGEL